MQALDKIKDVQRRLQELKWDGWLLYDCHGSNTLALEFLGCNPDLLATRRFFYFIPSHGEPIGLVHTIEPHVLDHLPGHKKKYLSWQSLEQGVKEMLNCKQHKRIIAMEYSPRNALPSLSKVDGGTLELVRGCGAEVVSSGLLLQPYTSVWDAAQLKTHLFAADVLDQTAQKTWEWISKALRENRVVNEWDVSQFIQGEFERNGCETDHPPLCAVGVHSSDPHYFPSKAGAGVIRKGDVVLIDLWCKKKEKRSVFADITRMAVAAAEPTPRQQEIFQIVCSAQEAGVAFIRKRLASKDNVYGWEADHACRKVIEEAGYGDFFVHRTGHNIYQENHGPGANLDGLETRDERPLIPSSIYSVEPGIYLPGEFGVRLEYDIVIFPDRTVKVTGGSQEAFAKLL